MVGLLTNGVGFMAWNEGVEGGLLVRVPESTLDGNGLIGLYKVNPFIRLMQPGLMVEAAGMFVY